MTELKVISWDWKDSISVTALSETLKPFGLVVFEVDTGGDSYAIVIGQEPMTQEDADAEYDKYCGDEDEE